MSTKFWRRDWTLAWPVQFRPCAIGAAAISAGTGVRARIRTTVSLVVVPVNSEDGAGGLVTDLRQNDFRIFETGSSRRLQLFSVDPFPLSAAVLVDDDLKRSSADRVQKTLEALAGGFSASDEVSLWRFDEVPESIFDFITDNDALLTQLKRIDLSSSFRELDPRP